MPAVPFIFNVLWASVEPPVFIMTGCFLSFGPLYRTNSGPRSLLRSLRSRLSRLSTKSASAGPVQAAPALENGEPGWEMLQEPHQDKSATSRAQWELFDVSTTDEIEPARRPAATMV